MGRAGRRSAPLRAGPGRAASQAPGRGGRSPPCPEPACRWLAGAGVPLPAGDKAGRRLRPGDKGAGRGGSEPLGGGGGGARGGATRGGATNRPFNGRREGRLAAGRGAVSRRQRAVCAGGLGG